jgi:hypothetical protein
VGIVELNEGPWLYAHVAVPPVRLHAGQPLRVTFHRPEGSEPVPVFVEAEDTWN